MNTGRTQYAQEITSISKNNENKKSTNKQHL
jgi:hypothetical protein